MFAHTFLPCTLCHVCQTINFKPWQQLTAGEKFTIMLCNDECDVEEYEAEDENFVSDAALYYIHHPNLATLQKSADDGCQFCYQICYGALNSGSVDVEETGYQQPVYLEMLRSGVAKTPREQLYQGELRVVMGTNRSADFRLREFKEDFVNFALVQRNPKSDSTTGSLANLDLAASWLHECQNDHPDCPRHISAQSPLPLRVLDIGSSGNHQRIFLAEGEGRTGSYATLSYCWGKFAPLPNHATTRSNIEERKECIHASILPKTFTDTISVCRHLDIRYLWIDSMCIIQGDADDWQAQSAEMANIYSKSILNISAAFGIDSAAGLFVDRDPRKTYPCPFSCSWIDEDGSAVTSSFLSCVNLDSQMDGQIDTRGWTFQESYLPRRTLRFSASGMYWICTSQNASETLPSGIPPYNTKSDFDKYVRSRPGGSLDCNKDSRQKKYAWWYKILRIYSMRRFSLESDRLIAIYGLASHIGDVLQDEYLAGIWISDIARGLAWRVVQSKDNTEEPPIINEHASFAVPSWSWASRPGKLIDYNGIEYTWHESLLIDDSIEDGEPFHAQHTCLDVLSSDFPLEPGKFSTLAMGTYLRIRGLILNARMKKEEFMMVLRPIGEYIFPSYCFPEFDEPVDIGDDLHCLPLFVSPAKRAPTTKEPETRPAMKDNCDTNTEELLSFQIRMLDLGFMLPGTTWCGDGRPHAELKADDCFHCLVLKKVGVEGMKFRRVGYVTINDGNLFEDVLPVILDLV